MKIPNEFPLIPGSKILGNPIQKNPGIPGFGKIASRKILGFKFLIPLGPGDHIGHHPTSLLLHHHLIQILNDDHQLQIALLAPSVCIELVSSISQSNISKVSTTSLGQIETPEPMDRTPGTPGSGKNDEKHCNLEMPALYFTSSPAYLIFVNFLHLCICCLQILK